MKDSNIKSTYIAGAFVILGAIITGILGFWQGVFNSTSPNNTPANNISVFTSTTINSDLFALTPVASNMDWQPHITERDFNGIPMVLVPTGSFQMGINFEQYLTAVEMCRETLSLPTYNLCSLENELSLEDNTQVISQPFWISTTEVTWGQYYLCVEAQACEPKNAFEDFAQLPPELVNQPIAEVNWFNARTFCEWSGGRLPTEVEWEYVARGPDNLTYPWGNEWNPLFANWNSNGNYGTLNYETVTVDSFRNGKSWVGALNMSGNVSEWTTSLMHDYPYNQQDGREQNTGNNENVARVVRGGSVLNEPYQLRSTYRDRNGVIYFGGGLGAGIGFRCVRNFRAN